MATRLNGQQIIDAFQQIIDDDLDPDYALFLLNAAKDDVEGGRDWNFNRGFDSSKSVGVSDNYLSTKSLPSDFSHPRALYLEGDINPYILIPFENRERFKDVYKRWYIDYMNGVFALCGSQGLSKAIHLYYGRSTDDITLETYPQWPAQFHKYLPFKMAEMWQSGGDGDEVNFRMSPANLRIASSLLKGFIAWDARIKVADYNAKNERRADLSSYPNVVGDEFIP